MQSPENWIYFPPPRRRGLLFCLVGLVLALGVVVYLLASAVSQQPGLPVILMLLGAFLVALPLPYVLYRSYALLQSGYWPALGVALH